MTERQDSMIAKVFTQTEKGPRVSVSFTLPSSTWADAIYLVGDFNDWNRTACLMQRDHDGRWSITLELEQGRCYQYRYLMDGNDWLTDNQADASVSNLYGSHNSVVVTDPAFKPYCDEPQRLS